MCLWAKCECICKPVGALHSSPPGDLGAAVQDVRPRETCFCVRSNVHTREELSLLAADCLPSARAQRHSFGRSASMQSACNARDQCKRAVQESPAFGGHQFLSRKTANIPALSKQRAREPPPREAVSAELCPKRVAQVWLARWRAEVVAKVLIYSLPLAFTSNLVRSPGLL